MTNKICNIGDCGRPLKCRGWCNRHYQKWVRHGDPLANPGRRMYATFAESHAARTRRAGDCLVWTGGLTPDGYGVARFEGASRLAHRAAWIAAHGPIPAGMTLDHVCHNRACVELTHLRLATRAENAQHRSGARSPSGHRNVYASQGGWRTRVRKDGRDYGSRHRLLEDAIAEAEALRLELFGEFAGKG